MILGLFYSKIVLLDSLSIDAFDTEGFIRGCTGFDVGFEVGAACRVTLGHVKTGEI